MFCNISDLLVDKIEENTFKSSNLCEFNVNSSYNNQ